MANLIRRFQSRRNDKLRLWILLFAGISVPILLCWVLPNMLSAQREAEADAQATATAEAAAAFRAANRELFDLCDAAPGEGEEVEGSGAVPENVNLLLLRNDRIADYQTSLSEQWQFDASQPATVVICLTREVSRPVDVCDDGTAPDLSEFQPTPDPLANPNTPVETVRLMRFVTSATVFNAETGEIIAHDRVMGSEPGICSDPVGGSLTGERLTSEELQAWLSEVLGS